MLERDHLLIEAAAADAARTRRIRSLPDGETLGAAAQAPPGRWSWLAGARLLVREGEDAALLMTVRQGWRWSRHGTVRDADDRHVGKVYAHGLVNARGQLLATAAASATTAAGWLTCDGRQLASFQPRSDGTLAVIFGPAADNNPFTRMLVLAAALLHAF